MAAGSEGAPRLLVAAGGTGGHLYPAVAVARELAARKPSAEVLFVGTRRGLEGRIVPRAGFRLQTLPVLPLRGGSLVRKLKGALLLPVGVLAAWRLLRQFRPHVVFGMGGYVSGPVLAAAALSGVPTLLLEPNWTPGLANRWLARLVDQAAVAWEGTREFFGAKAFVSGNPVREEITRVPERAPGRVMQVLVFGGSQGSQVLNRAMTEALAYLAAHRERLSLAHQTGDADLGWVRARYREAEFTARVEPYFEAMEREYAEADVVVARAGAMTCAELAAAGRPSILVPLPHAGGHQEANARAMAAAGAARSLPQSELSGEALAATLVELLDQPSLRRQMAAEARKLFRPDAARSIVDRLLALAARSGEAGA